MSKLKTYTCLGCGERFKAERKKKLCGECRSMFGISKTKDITIIERERADYNRRHKLHISYGKFVEKILKIERSVKK